MPGTKRTASGLASARQTLMMAKKKLAECERKIDRVASAKKPIKRKKRVAAKTSAPKRRIAAKVTKPRTASKVRRTKKRKTAKASK